MFAMTMRRAAAMLAAACAMAAALPAWADLGKLRESGTLKVAVYKDMPPFYGNAGGIDVDLAQALAEKLGLKLSLLPFPAGDDLNDDLRNMVWKGHYLGYGPADVMLHVPVDRRLMAQNDKVEIFAPYYRETLRLVRSVKRVPQFAGLDSLAGKRIGVEQVSISGMLMLGEQNGRFRDAVKIYPTEADALAALKSGDVDAVLANRSGIEAALHGDADYALEEVAFQRMPSRGWVVGMAVKKESRDLAEALQKAADELTASGEMARIFTRHGVQPVTP
ncbi:substrate-binding periplasmic protein [Noviherbaspirillum pedocola]|nr:transporter substrate-binding domain-containing protein [Noviherbaspirillum pedocola]